MPRRPRLIEDGSYHHIITRGNDRKRLFRCDKDYVKFLVLVNEAIEKHPVAIYHYCLMNNHIHMLTKVIMKDDFPKFFQALFQRYANYFRKRYHHTGFLYQNRYKNIHIDKDSYLLDCARYIERNPVRAKIVSDPSEYKWSSYSHYAKGIDDDIIKEQNPLYVSLGDTIHERQHRYRSYILEERPYEHIVDKGLRIE